MMSINKTTAIIIMGICMAASILGAAELAVLIPEEEGGFWHETDILAEEIQLERFKPSQYHELVKRLREFRMVIVGTQSNYQAKHDFAAEKAQWLDFFKGGGIMLALDSNYVEMTTLVFGAFCPEPLNHRWGCVNAEEERRVSPVEESRMLFSFPYSGDEEFPMGLGGGHFVEPDTSWRVLAQCIHGKPVIVEQAVGNGKIVATTLFALFSANGKRFLRSLVVNLMTQQTFREAELELDDFHVAYKADNAEFYMELRNISNKEYELNGRLVFGENKLPMQSLNTLLAPGESSKIELEMRSTENLTAGVVITSPKNVVFTGRFTPPDLSPKWQLPVRIFSARTRIFRIPVLHRSPETYRSVSLQADGAEIPVTLSSAKAEAVIADLSHLAPGKHTFGLTLETADGTSISFPEQQTVITENDMKLNVDSEGNLLKDGRPFFPISWYHVSRAKGLTAESRMKCLEYCAKYGYNMMFMHTLDDSSDDEFMRRAAELGIALFCDVRNVKTIREKKDEWLAVVSWMRELDEPEHWGYTPEDVRQRARQIFEMDDRCPVFSSMETALTVRRYAGVCDLIATHGYPIPDYSLKLVSDKLRLLTDLAQQYMFVPLGTVQCFGYPEDPASGYLGMPTARQVRNLAFQALAANVKGVNFYTWEDGGFSLLDHPDLDAMAQKLPRQISYCVPYLQNGVYERLDGENDKIVGASWKWGQQSLQIWINTDKADQTFVLPQNVRGMVPVFGTRELPEGEKLTMEPEEVIIWEK